MKYRFFLLLFSVVSGGSQFPQVDQLGTWIANNYETVIDLIMPVEDLPGLRALKYKFPEDAEWNVTVRIEPHDEPPIRFSMTKNRDGKLEVSITSMTSPLSDLLKDLRRKHPTTGVEEIAKLIPLIQFKLSSEECLELETLATAFEDLNIAPLMPDEIWLHGTNYEICSQSSAGNLLCVRYLLGPDSKAQRQKYPILGWVEDMRKVIRERCAGKMVNEPRSAPQAAEGR